METKVWSSTAPAAEFTPYTEAEGVREFTFRAVMLGALFGVLFGAVSVYVGLRAGLTVSASIPIAVLSISILRAFGRSTILENNIVQTTGSAGESAAAGVIFTMPALIFLGFSLNTEYWRVFFLALLGGTLGVLFMIPLRRQLIVKEHGNLTFPEGTACADVLVAGERGGSFAGRVFWGLGLGGVYTILMNTFGLWPSQPDYQPKWLPGASMRCTITSEYLGVGYIIGPRVAGTLFAGGVISWLVLMPAIRFFGSLAPGVALYPSTMPIPANESGSALGNLHSSHRCGRRRRVGTDHADQNDADDFRGARRRTKGHACQTGGDASGPAHGAGSLDAGCDHRLARDSSDDLGAPEI